MAELCGKNYTRRELETAIYGYGLTLKHHEDAAREMRKTLKGLKEKLAELDQEQGKIAHVPSK
jgi:predicted nuclease with TOPRIM domain